MEIFLLIFGLLLAVFGGLGYFSDSISQGVRRKFWNTDEVRMSPLGLEGSIKYMKFKAGISFLMGIFILCLLLLKYFGVMVSGTIN